MERRNYFEMLGLDFDPPEKNEERIQQAIAAWKKRTEDLLANEVNETRRSELSAELGLRDDMAETFKDVKAKNAEARKLKEQRIGQLEKLIDIMLIGQTGTPEVTNAQIRNVSLKLRLPQDTIKKVYQNKGYSLVPPAARIKLDDYFFTTVVWKNLNDYLATLQRVFSKDVSQQQFYPWVKGVDDLYSLACYFSGKNDVKAFSEKKTAELYSIMEVGSQKFVTAPNNALLKALSDLFSFGQSQVFSSEINRKKYDQTLEREKLKELFLLLKSAPDEFKRDRYFAESCIKTIQKSFPDYNLSLALYNQEAGLKQDPYEPIEALIHVTCGSCKNPMEFRTREEAEKGKCAVCGAELYVTCPNPQCHKKVPASADRCSCGFRISEMQFFDEYYNAAQFALKEMNLAEARKQLENAQNAYPGHPKLAELQSRFKAENDKYQKPLNDLQALISRGHYYSAQKHLETLTTSMPQLKVESQRKLVANKLAEVQGMMPAVTMSTTDRGNRYVEILEIVKDYQPAIDMLRLCKPNQPMGIHGSIDVGKQLSCTLTWNAAVDKGVSYCVVRKKGGVPQRYTEGDMLAQGRKELEYKDESIQPGIRYGYAVFAYRNGVYSDPATCEIIKFSELDEGRIQAIADDGICRFSWVLPENAIGVRITRSENAIPTKQPDVNCTIVSERASANCEDADVINNRTYGYRLQCIYPYDGGFRYSDGYTVMLTPEKPPVSLKNVNVKTEGRTVYVHWATNEERQSSVMFREVTSDDVDGLVGKNIPASEINSILGNGKTYANTTNMAQQCQFDIPANTSIKLAIVVVAGAKGIVSNTVRVSSIEKCEINKAETRIDAGRLRIILKDIPKNLERIHYVVARKVDSHIPWATVDDAKRKVLNSIIVQDYYRDGMILIESIPKDDLYVSVIGQYKMPDGSVVYADASKMKISNKPKVKIKYKLIWEEGFFFARPKRKKCKLSVLTDAKETPTMKLVYRSDGHIPMKLLDPRTIVLHTIPESEGGFPSGSYVYEFPESTWKEIKPQSELRLMLADEDMMEYEILTDDIKSLKVPQ